MIAMVVADRGQIIRFQSMQVDDAAHTHGQVFDALLAQLPVSSIRTIEATRLHARRLCMQRLCICAYEQMEQIAFLSEEERNAKRRW